MHGRLLLTENTNDFLPLFVTSPNMTYMKKTVDNSCFNFCGLVSYQTFKTGFLLIGFFILNFFFIESI